MTPTGYFLLAIGAAGFGAAMLFLGFFLSKRIGEGKILAAERMAERIVAEAQREAETLKRSAHLEAKEEAYRAKAAFEKEAQAKRQEIGQQERRLVEREGSIDRKADLLRKKEGDIDLREKDLTST
jgi:ribonuclease Y